MLSVQRPRTQKSNRREKQARYLAALDDLRAAAAASRRERTPETRQALARAYRAIADARPRKMVR